MPLLGLLLATWAIILVTVFFTGVWVQILIFHYRGAFYRIWMWEPVVYLPVVVIAGIVALIVGELALDIYGIILIAAFLVGLSGTVFHIQGVLRQVGGWNLDNVMVGPPLLLPIGVSTVSLMGVTAVYYVRF